MDPPASMRRQPSAAGASSRSTPSTPLAHQKSEGESPRLRMTFWSRHARIGRSLSGPRSRHQRSCWGVRMQAMELFLADYDRGKAEGRYVTAELPLLPFEDCSFDLAVCSHFLSGPTTARRSVSSHLDQGTVSCRKRGTYFPAPRTWWHRFRDVSPIADLVRQLGYTVTIDRVPYEFQRGANKMMRILTAGDCISLTCAHPRITHPDQTFTDMSPTWSPRPARTQPAPPKAQ